MHLQPLLTVETPLVVVRLFSLLRTLDPRRVHLNKVRQGRQGLVTSAYFNQGLCTLDRRRTHLNKVRQRPVGFNQGPWTLDPGRTHLDEKLAQVGTLAVTRLGGGDLLSFKSR